VSRALVYAPRAREDLDAIAGWLTQPGAGRTARRKLVAIWKAIEGLRESPCRYPIGDHAGVRELPCARSYRVLYDVIPDTGRSDTAGDVRILRVFGPGQSRDKV
jgi:plasmid stabilization system protein ParE